MALTSGTKLGPYEILSPLGAGGMGEVYRSRDTRLDRTVAIKVLPESLASDSERLQRFEQEARVLSTLSHPNLLAIYDVGTQGGIHYLVSEYLEGQTLRERMNEGALPQRKLAECALQLASGLAAAHDKGIVHRDLKPENIFITRDERVKILDFGLAKQSLAVASLTGETATIGSPAATTPGTVLGTVGYMSPEQVRGHAADHRSDIFSFGALLYEMATGKRAFLGDTGVEVMSAILKNDPAELNSPQSKVLPGLERIVRHCLEKNPENRFQSASDLAFAIGALSGTESTAAAGSVRMPAKRSWLPWAGGGLALLTVIALAMILNPKQPQAELREFAIPLQVEVSHVALSPDGRMLAFISPDEASGANVLSVQRIGSLKPTVLAGSEGANYPLWSPDADYVAFFADGKLKKIAASGGVPQILASAPNARGGSWGRRGVIVYTPESGGCMWKVNADGSNAVALTDKIIPGEETSHRWPIFLEDGERFLFWAGNFTNAPDDRVSGIYLSDLTGQEKKLLLLAHSSPGYANGYVFYVDDRKSLRAIAVDTSKAATAGESRVVAEEVGIQPSTYYGAFTVAANGTVVYDPTIGAALSALTWIDRSGKELSQVGEVGVLANPALSPDGKRVAVDVSDVRASNIDIWIRDMEHGTSSRFTFAPGEEVAGAWSRDGSLIAFRAIANRGSVYSKRVQGLEPARKLFEAPANSADEIIPNSWSRDDQLILSTYLPALGGTDIVVISAADGKVAPFLATKASETSGQISPDGKWVAYTSNESGDWEIYVTTFPSAAGKWQVSRGGGSQPRWRGDGKEIFYIGARGEITAVPVNSDSSFSTGTPVPLFQARARAQISSTDMFNYDVAKDGKRFLVARYVKPKSIAPLVVVLNATAEKRKKDTRNNNSPIRARMCYTLFALITSVVLCGSSGAGPDLRMPAFSLLRTFSA